ncbi:MAG: hypothetical protein AAFY45_13400 [Bacteroidota bacterium]
MNRKEFLKLSGVASLSLGLSARPFSLPATIENKKDKYGGWIGKKFEATGFFRVEKADRWWMVSPEGNAFLSFGVNHFHAGWWKAAYNREAWMKLMRIEDLEAFDPNLRLWFFETCKTYGFNSIGVHSSLNVLNQPQPAMPYVQPIQFIDISHWKNSIKDENFLDIFSVEFEKHCDSLAQEKALPLRNDPYLLGYAMADCPLFTEEDCRERTDTIYGARRKGRIGWPKKLRNQAEDSDGKQAYVKLMKKLYEGDVQSFNNTYSTDFNSFQALQKAVNWRLETDLSNGFETRDNIEFLKLCVDRYYKTAHESIRRYDPNHLFFGDKLNGNTDTVDTVLPITTKYTDVLFYQMYGKYELQKTYLDSWHTKVDIPIINGDSAFTHIRELMPQPYGPIANSEEQNAAWTSEFFHKAFARPEFVGWHYCGLIDTPKGLIQKEADRQHSGFFDGYGNPYDILKDTIRDCSKDIYEIGLGHKAAP